MQKSIAQTISYLLTQLINHFEFSGNQELKLSSLVAKNEMLKILRAEKWEEQEDLQREETGS